MRNKIKEIMKRDLMPFPNKQDNLEYTEEDVILIAETFAKEYLSEQLKLYGVVKSLPTKEIIDYLEKTQDFYINVSETANLFYNAALNDVKFFIEKREEKLN